MLTRTLYFSSRASERTCIDTRLVVVGETPVDNEHFLRVDVDENVLGLDVAMHDSSAVRVVQPLH